jgi:Domain of unknown function (DUF6930)
MVDQRQLERLLQQVERLKQREEYWAGTTRLARLWITPDDAPPYRPYLTLLLSQQGKIVSSHVQEQPPTAALLLAWLLRAMRRPALGSGRARRPTRVYLDNAEHVAALTPRLEALHIECVHRPTLAMADEVVAALETQWGRYELPPGLVSMPSVTLPMVGHLHELAAQFYRVTPWRWFNDHHPFALRVAPEEAPRYAMVMGNAGEVFGLSVYDTLDDLRLVFSPALSHQEVARMSTWFVLFFEEAPAVSFEDLDAIAEHGWPVAAPHAYPVFGRSTADQGLALPSKADLLWMEGALAGLLAYIDQHMVLRRGVPQLADVTMSVTRMDGEVPVRLQLLGFDAIFK